MGVGGIEGTVREVGVVAGGVGVRGEVGITGVARVVEIVVLVPGAL